MGRLVDFGLKAISKFGIFDFAVFKICLISLGILLGVYFSVLFSTYITIIWVIFVLSYVYVMYKIFRKNK